MYIQNGFVGIGYRLFNEVFFGWSIGTTKQTTPMAIINDYSCLHNKSSEFLYKPIDVVEAFAIRREKFRIVMNHPQALKVKTYIAKYYKFNI